MSADGKAFGRLPRFVEELAIGDPVMTYDPGQRLYFIGEIISNVANREHDLFRARSVHLAPDIAGTCGD